MLRASTHVLMCPAPACNGWSLWSWLLKALFESMLHMHNSKWCHKFATMSMPYHVIPPTPPHLLTLPLFPELQFLAYLVSPVSTADLHWHSVTILVQMNRFSRNFKPLFWNFFENFPFFILISCGSEINIVNFLIYMYSIVPSIWTVSLMPNC